VKSVSTEKKKETSMFLLVPSLVTSLLPVTAALEDTAAATHFGVAAPAAPVLAAAAAPAPLADPSAGDKPLTIWWFQWKPADGLQELSAEFTKQTGVEVKVRQIPLSSYQDQTFIEFGNATATHPTEFDIVVGDSQWIGRGATKGLYVDLTDWLKTVVDLKTIHEHAARYLCEYPEGSGKWFAAPCETDACGLAYRKDWFEDPKEKAAFKAKYNRELTVPDTWDEFKQVAEFFQRPAEKRYGCAFTTHRGYDALTMGVQNLFWAYGGEWHEPGSNRIKGFLDTKGSADAIEMFKQLMKLGPKGAEKLDYGESVEYLKNGSVAMCVNYFAFFPSILEKLGDKAGFAVVPKGPKGRVPSLGGQGMSISTKIPAARQELAKKFIAWFEKRETQEQWIKKPAGFTANVEILKSAAFRNASPYNGPFADSVDAMRDFWNCPPYNELLTVTQKYVGDAVDGQMDTMEALRQLADESEQILKENGLLK
jgi:multiple sugar transport system substrate-binding protein